MHVGCERDVSANALNKIAIQLQQTSLKQREGSWGRARRHHEEAVRGAEGGG